MYDADVHKAAAVLPLLTPVLAAAACRHYRNTTLSFTCAIISVLPTCPVPYPAGQLELGTRDKWGAQNQTGSFCSDLARETERIFLPQTQ